jgi:hypothetical protein
VILNQKMEKKGVVDKTRHIIYQGIDFCDSTSNDCILHYSQNDVVSVFNTRRVGARLIWFVGDRNELTAKHINRRLKMPTNGQCTFLQSSCMIGFNQCCSGSIICYRLKNSKSWKLGIVSSIRYKMNPDSDMINLYTWIGNISSFGVPTMCLLKTWNSMKGHLEYIHLPLKSIVMYFVNQIRGDVPMCGSIKLGTRNESDGGVQSCKTGPDKWEIPKPAFDELSNNMTISNHVITDHSICRKNLLVKNNSTDRCQLRNRIKSQVPKSENKDIHSFNRPPNYIPRKDQVGLVIIVKDEQGNDLLPTFSSAVPNEVRGTFNVGSMNSAFDNTTVLQDFYCIEPTDFVHLQSQFPNGMMVGEDANEDIDCILHYYSSSKISLLSSDKISSRSQESSSNYHDYVRLFAGDGSPSVDSSFNVCKDVPGYVIYYKFVPSRYYTEFSPLSVGFFETTFHGIKIPHIFISLINRVSGKNGSFPSRSRMNHNGHVSYLGKRKKTSQSQPTVSEGPKERGYWYHRAFTKHAYWPFVLWLLKYLAGLTSVAPYYFYHHLRNLYTYSNSVMERIKFCDIIILTMDFCSACHCDLNDKQGWCFQDMSGRLQEIINNKYISGRRRQEAIASLKHILWWGVSTPTTCCYQYVFRKTKDEDKIEIFQWFLCPGLGTTHRIRNFWVHIMLAGLFSHCTSSPIYIVNNRVYFGKCPEVNMFAWGTG